MAFGRVASQEVVYEGVNERLQHVHHVHGSIVQIAKGRAREGKPLSVRGGVRPLSTGVHGTSELGSAGRPGRRTSMERTLK